MDRTYFTLLAGMVGTLALAISTAKREHTAAAVFWMVVFAGLMLAYLIRWFLKTRRTVRLVDALTAVDAARNNPVNRSKVQPVDPLPGVPVRRTTQGAVLERASATIEAMNGEDPVQTILAKKRYVLGFMFDRGGNPFVVLIHKKPTRPEQMWQDGMLNGIGGGIEPGESAVAAMVREFREETGMETAEEDWSKFAELDGQSGYNVAVFMARGDTKKAKTPEGSTEKIEAISVDELYWRSNLIYNLCWLIPLALEKDGPVIVAKYR